jgi:hypothetical protein
LVLVVLVVLVGQVQLVMVRMVLLVAILVSAHCILLVVAEARLVLLQPLVAVVLVIKVFQESLWLPHSVSVLVVQVSPLA